jgi:hypothetical protein
MTLEAMRVARMLPVGEEGTMRDVAGGNGEAPHWSSRQAESPRRTEAMDECSRNAECVRQNVMHGETKDGTDRRDTGGEG